jgi:cyclophilin family peptidyl-prolyl cis-trans isomerase
MFRFTILVLALMALLMQPAGAEEKNPVVVIDTSMGTIEVELYKDKAPGTVANFLAYVNDKFYDGTIFHRVMDGFMIQGGGFTPDMQQKAAKDPIKNESGNGLKNDRGTIAMARTNDPDSATAQFFINVVDNSALDKANCQDGVGYCVFGKVIKGIDVVDKIKTVKTTTKWPHQNVPVETVKINSITIKKG